MLHIRNVDLYFLFHNWIYNGYLSFNRIISTRKFFRVSKTYLKEEIYRIFYRLIHVIKSSFMLQIKVIFRKGTDAKVYVRKHSQLLVTFEENAFVSKSLLIEVFINKRNSSVSFHVHLMFIVFCANSTQFAEVKCSLSTKIIARSSKMS